MEQTHVYLIHTFTWEDIWDFVIVNRCHVTLFDGSPFEWEKDMMPWSINRENDWGKRHNIKIKVKCGQWKTSGKLHT